LKILYLTNQFYLHGGIEKMLSQKIRYLIEEFNYDVVLCTSEHYNNPFVYSMPEKLRHIDLKINYIKSKSYFHPANLLRAIVHYKRLKQIIKEEQPDVILSVNFTPEQYFLPFVSKQIPKVKEFHSSGINLNQQQGIFGKFRQRLFQLFGKYDRLIVLNPDEKQYYPFNNVSVIPNFIKLSPQIDSSKKENTIIAAGRITPVKQFDHLIKAWSQIAIRFPDWQVKIFGDGEEELKGQLKALIAQLNVSNICLMGATRDLQDQMERAAVFAMTSATECFPMVLLEAQAAQMAILSYDCPHGPQNIITTNKTGVLTPPNDIDEFANMLENLLSNSSKRERLARQAQQEVKAFSTHEIMSLWQTLFNDLTD